MQQNHHFSRLDVSRLDENAVFLSIAPDLTLQMGTCGHCVVLEKGRPERAEDPTGNSLDFPRDQFLALMSAFGVELTILEEYKCP